MKSAAAVCEEGPILRLPDECRLLVKIIAGVQYMIQISPLMYSVAATLDIAQVQAATREAYTRLMGWQAPSYFGLVVRCISVEGSCSLG